MSMRLSIRAIGLAAMLAAPRVAAAQMRPRSTSRSATTSMRR